MKRFTAYRRNISQRDTHNELQKNADHEPQFEGVIWSDGTVTLRWLTACRSTSVWANIEDCLNIHGHVEYGTEIVWHDGPAPQAWVSKVEAALVEYDREIGCHDWPPPPDCLSKVEAALKMKKNKLNNTITIDRKVLEWAIEQIYINSQGRIWQVGHALSEALNSPEPEPVAGVVSIPARVGFGRIEDRKNVRFFADLPVGTLLYATPSRREWVGLTDAEIEHVWVEGYIRYEDCRSLYYAKKIARAIEQALKEKNTRLILEYRNE